MFDSVVKHRKHFTRVGDVNYHSHFPPNLNPVPPDNLRNQWKADYQTMQREMIYGDSPSFEELIESIKKITEAINNQEWIPLCEKDI